MNKRYTISVSCSLLFVLVCCFSSVHAQNVAVTDDGLYSPDASAMLDVYSTTKGMLVPRVTTVQRNAIGSPAIGLMVFDITQNCFYFYTGSGWTHISSGGNTNDIWGRTGSNVYLNTSSDNVGIGTTTPNCKLEVKQPSTGAAGDTLFQVKDNLGNTVFAVFPEGVRVFIDDLSPKGSVAGFAVTGRTSNKSPLKGDYFLVTTDSCRIYIEESGGSVSGFAVTGRTSTKGITNQLLRVTRDSTRVWTKDPSKGFGISDISGTSQSYMRLTPQNYFIGHLSGLKNTSGQYNSYLGYQTGLNNSMGCYNSFFGFEAGKANTSSDNTFIGYKSGLTHDVGGGNVFIGSKAGQNDVNGFQNVFIGESAGFNNGGGSQNVFMGLESGYSNNTGSFNVFIGCNSGSSNNSGYKNTFIGYNSGTSNTTGYRNVFVGDSCGVTNTTGQFNVFLGNTSGKNNTTGMANTFLGQTTGANNTTGVGNVCVGAAAGRDNAEGVYNTYLGPFSGGFRTGGDYNISIGMLAGSFFSGSYNVCIGYNAGLGEAGSNKLYIANTSTYPLIYGDFASPKVGIGFNSPTSTLDVYVTGNNGNAGIGITSALPGGRHLTMNQGTAGKLNFTEPGVSDVMTIDFVNKNVGIKNTNPIYILDVVGRSRFQSDGIVTAGVWYTSMVGADRAFVGMINDNNYGFWGNGGAGWGVYFDVNSGAVRMPAVYTSVVGGVNRDLFIDNTGLIGYVVSSRKYKEDISDILDLSWLYQLRPVTYHYKTDSLKNLEYGLIAEEVELVNHRLVSFDNKGNAETVVYSKLITPMLKAIQDQNDKINCLQGQIENYKSVMDEMEKMKKENEELKAEIEKIKALLESSAEIK
jgi:hypothetical protein